MEYVRKKIIIHGRVQGVFFRQNAKEEAERRNIKGWIKNMPDGSVLVHAVGEAEDMDGFIKWCWKGPEKSRIDNIQTEDLPLPGEYSDFRISP